MNLYKTDWDPSDNSLLFYEKTDLEKIAEETHVPYSILEIYFHNFGVIRNQTIASYTYMNIDYNEQNNMIDMLVKLIRESSINKILK